MAEQGGINAIRVISDANRNQTNPLERRRENNPNAANAQAPRQQEPTAGRNRANQDRVEITREARQQNIRPTPTTDQTPAERTRQAQRPQSTPPSGAQGTRDAQERQGTPPAAPQQGQQGNRVDGGQAQAAGRRGNQNELNPVRQNENPLNRRIQAVQTNQRPRVRNESRQFQPGQDAIGQRNQAREAQARQEDRARFEAGLNQAPGQNPNTQRTAANPPQANGPGQSQNAEQRNTEQAPDLQRAIETQNRDGNTAQQSTPVDLGPEGDTQTNVQRTRAALEERQAQQQARETPVFETPPQNIGQIQLNSQANQNPPTPGLEGSVAQRAEAAAQRAQVERDRADAAREATRQQREQVTNGNNTRTNRDPRAAENRNPAAAQTRVGENVDRLV